MSRLKSSYHHGHLAEALENAALDLLRERGSAGLSLREVSRVAGTSHNAPYHHFRDRTALLVRLGERCLGDLLARADAVLVATAEAPAPDRAVAVFAAYIRYASEYPERFELIYSAEICPHGTPSPGMAAMLERVRNILGPMSAALRSGSSPQEQQSLGTALWGMGHGLAELVVSGAVPAEAAEPALQQAIHAIAAAPPQNEASWP